jgi:DNA-binding NarL/FixJ family response regulator
MPPTVLLVDDEPHVLTGLQRALRKEPYTVLCASSVAEAFTILRHTPVQAVVSDQDMPDTMGTLFLARVSEEFPDTVRCILTGKSTLEAAEEALHAGVISTIFTKPCDRATLSETLRRGFAQHGHLAGGPEVPPTLAPPLQSLDELARQHPEQLRELLQTIHQILRDKGLRPASQGAPTTMAAQLVELDQLRRQHPDLLRELLHAFDRLLRPRSVRVEPHRASQPVAIMAPAADVSAAPIKAPQSQEELDETLPGDTAFAECLRQLSLAAQSEQDYPGILWLQRDTEGIRIATLEERSFADCRLRCLNAAEVFLLRMPSGKVLQATPVSIDASYLMVDTHRTTVFYKPGERLLAIFPVPPHGYYVWLAWIETIYFKRFKLRYRAPY